MPATPVHPDVTALLDEPTNTVSYVIKDPASSSGAVVDSILGFDYASGRTSFAFTDRIIDIANAAEQAGLDAFYLPVVPGKTTASQVTERKNILSRSKGPIRAYCASGNRFACAYEMARRA